MEEVVRGRLGSCDVALASSKFKSEWTGPYKVVDTVGKTSYRIQVRPSRVQTFHINLLKKWLGPLPASAHVVVPMPNRSSSCTLDQLVINPELGSMEEQSLDALLRPFSSLFSDSPGRTSLIDHSIITPPGQIVKHRPYCIPAARREAVRQEIMNMIDMGVIRPCKSKWSSPIVLVPKPDGSTRFCMDFRSLNSICKSDAYPIPRIDELVEKIGNSRYITTFDLTKGYWQVPLKESDKEKTAFVTPDGLYEFNVLPFGLHGAPATFQHLMNAVLREHQAFSSAYLDDIVVFSPTWEEHMQLILQYLLEAGLHINSKKSRVGFHLVNYLGYVLGQGVIAPQKEKVRANKDTPFPATKREVNAFLGLLGYYSNSSNNTLRKLPHLLTYSVRT